MTIAANHDEKGRFTAGNSSGQKFAPGNKLSVRSGTFCRLSLCDLPAKLASIKRSVNDFRATLETAVRERFDGVSVVQAAHINTAAWNERLLRLWARRLAKDYETLTDDGIARCADRIAKHAAARDAALARLRLDDDAVDALSLIYDTLPASLCEAAAVEPPVLVDDGQAPAAVGDTELTT